MADERSGKEKGWPKEDNGFQLPHEEFVDGGLAPFCCGLGFTWEFLGRCRGDYSNKLISDGPTDYASNFFFS